MTKEEHQKHHVLLHDYLDEIVSDYISNGTGLPSKNTILDLMRWTDKQAMKVDHNFGGGTNG